MIIGNQRGPFFNRQAVGIVVAMQGHAMRSGQPAHGVIELGLGFGQIPAKGPEPIQANHGPGPHGRVQLGHPVINQLRQGRKIAMHR